MKSFFYFLLNKHRNPDKEDRKVITDSLEAITRSENIKALTSKKTTIF